jgi:hypothetical protein
MMGGNKIRPKNRCWIMVYGGERGIRTLETVSRLHAFQACAFNHSATSPVARTIAGGSHCASGVRRSFLGQLLPADTQFASKTDAAGKRRVPR